MDFNVAIASFEDCFEGAKEDLSDLSEDERVKQERISEIHEFMRANLSADAYLLFQLQMSPPPFFYSEESKPRLTTSSLLDFSNCLRLSFTLNISLHLIKKFMKLSKI